ncbi:uncharacterized protein N7503_005160 [Penicillium pulvis]|uniref:uncharacterized protein n=1 Tax=Penicillium pulvis TaxID=1562058 RepID=UPI0025486ADC|nr:uncharacterized protein N7503_005160 [Penicillium pulvis]KAJ5802710.1 hypothetical protein N7503_005160 [Penicillium pulvis]
MCRYAYHHYPNCGHIANYTVMGCLEFTNQLRYLANVEMYLACDDIKISHDLLPADHPDLCLQCAYEWKSTYPQQEHETQFAKRNRAMEGLNAANSIIDFKARMVGPKSSDTNAIHGTRTDIYQSNPLRRNPECTCSACVKLASVGSDVREDLDVLTCGSPMSLESLSLDTSDSSCVSELNISHALHFNLYEVTNPCSQLSLDHEKHGLYIPAGGGFDVCDIDNLFPTLCDFDHQSYVSIGSSHNDEADIFELMPGIVTDCLAQLDLDCVEDHATDSTNIDLLAGLPSHKDVILELVQAFRTGIISNGITHEISTTAKSKTTHKSQAISKTSTLNHSDSKTSLWRASMSSASSPEFRNSADKWFLGFELSSFGTEDNIDTLVRHGTTAEFLDFSDDEDGGCLLAGW